MNIDVSKVTYEESYEVIPGEWIAYFVASKKFVSDKYPEADHATISIEWNESSKDLSAYRVSISPTKDRTDYDWTPIDMDVNDIEQLLTMAKNSRNYYYNPVEEAYKILVNEMQNSNNDVDYMISHGAIEEAVGYLGEALE